MPAQISNETVRSVRQLISTENISGLSEVLADLTPAEHVALIDKLSSPDAAITLRLLDKNIAIDVFDSLNTRTQADIVSELGDSRTMQVVTELDPDEQARLLDELPAKITKQLLQNLPKKQHDDVMVLLGYKNNSAGRQMSPVSVHFAPTQTVGQAFDRLRELAEDVDIPETIAVTDPERILVGTVRLLDLVRNNDDSLIGDIMTQAGPFAFTDDNAEQVARRALDLGEPIAVVDSERRLVGMLTLVDAAEIDREAMAEDQARAGASEPLRRPYLLTPVLAITRARIVWLLVLAISAILTVQVLEMFETTLSQRVVLALFIPLLTGVGGNTGSQAATTVTRALALAEVEIRDVGRVAFKEIRTGLLLGSTLGVIAFLGAWAVYGIDIGLIIGLTMLINCPIAAAVGGLIPLLARACKVDPAVFSTPFISTFCDASGLLIYFTVAVSILGL